jgi:3'-phosphoadenosine 5'-phosphosulfate sulfotransferase (PAPS reductase)/FAD synthetase
MNDANLGPREIVDRAIAEHKPVAIYVGFSGGNDSRAVTHWAMNNVPGCQPFHINTGIGIERTREYVRQTCRQQGWPLHEIRAKEDCGQDYDEIVKKHGFPGPDGHRYMYVLLKERAIDELVRRSNRKWLDRVMLICGARYDESVRRMGYGGQEVARKGAQVWVNATYWWSKAARDAYNATSGIPENPVSRQLGMSGECGCGAYAHPGELKLWRAVDPTFGERIDRLSQEALARGYTWAWDGRPPSGGFNPDQATMDGFHPLCFGCEKSAIVKHEL